MSENSSTHVTARITDDELQEILEQQADKHGSQSEAIREALRQMSMDDATDTELPDKAHEGYRILRDYCAVGDTVDIESAESLVAQELQINADAVRRMVIRPLVEKKYLEKRQTMQRVVVTVKPRKQDKIVMDGGTPLAPGTRDRVHYCTQREQLIQCPRRECNHCTGVRADE
jgi:Arc/MetJ-type ribon-helix-helix transcriptional regulator